MSVAFLYMDHILFATLLMKTRDKSPSRITFSWGIYIYPASVLSPSLSTEHHKAGAGERSVLGDRDKRGWQLKQKTTLLYAYSIILYIFIFHFRVTYNLISSLNVIVVYRILIYYLLNSSDFERRVLIPQIFQNLLIFLFWWENF